MTQVKNTNIQYLHFQPAFKAHQNVFEKNKENALPVHIEKLLKDVEKAKDYNAFWEILNNYAAKRPNITKTADNAIKDGEFIIKAGADLEIDYDKSVLNALHQKGIKMAPTFVKSASSKEGFGVSVSQIEGTKSGELLDFNKTYRLLSEDAKKTAYNDLKNLTKLGIANLDILDRNGLKITPDYPNRIVCDHWTNLCPVEDCYAENSSTGARLNVLNRIHKLIFKTTFD